MPLQENRRDAYKLLIQKGPAGGKRSKWSFGVELGGADGRTPGPGWRKCAVYRQTGPGGLPLALRLSEGLGSTARGEATEVFMDYSEPSAFIREYTGSSALNLELSASLGAFPVVRIGCRR